MTSSVKINLCKSNRRSRENYCRITRSPKHLFNYKHVFILSDIKPQHLFAWFCSYELPDPFFCMLTTIYGAFLHFLWIYCYTSVSLWTCSPSDLLFLVVNKTSWLQQLSLCVVVVFVVVVDSVCVNLVSYDSCSPSGLTWLHLGRRSLLFDKYVNLSPVWVLLAI